MTLGTSHYPHGGSGEKHRGGGEAKMFFYSLSGGEWLCISFNCLSVAFKTLKRKIMVLNKKLTAENATEVTKLHPFSKFSKGSMPPALKPTPLLS